MRNPLLSNRGRTGIARAPHQCALLVIPLLLSLAACGPGEREPTRLASRAGLDASVLAGIDAAHARAAKAPGDAEAHGMLALAYDVNLRFTEAIESYGNAAALDSTDPLWPYHAALCKSSLGDTEAALSDLDEVVRRFPDQAAMRFRLGDWRLKAGDVDGALEEFEAAMSLGPDDGRMGVGLGAALLEDEQITRAIEVLTQALEARPDDGAAHFLRGRAYRAAGQPDRAESEMALGLGALISYPGTRLDGMRDRYRVGKGGLVEDAFELMNAGRYAEAIATLERARKSFPNDKDVLNNLGAVYHKDGQMQQYLDVILEAERLDPSYPPTMINLSFAHLELNHADEALKAARHAVLLAPNNAQGQLALGRSLLAIGDGTSAYYTLVRSVELDPSLRLARGILIDVCMATERWVQSRDHLLVMTRDVPGFLPHAVNLGQVSVLLGDLDTARIALEQARRIQPDHPRVLALAAKISEAQ